MKLNPAPHYRKDAFEAGLEAHGYRIDRCPSDRPVAGDVLVLWNRYARDEAHARRYEAAKATVLITENAWLGPEEKDEHLFALCRGHHNGAGSWHVGSGNRWSGSLAPWRRDGHHILVLPQRGMGEHGVKQPSGWLPDVIERLAKLTQRPIQVRYHPGQRPHPPIDFEGCWAAVTWASGAGIKAITEGIPVFHEFPKWIGAPAARPMPRLDFEDPFLGDRTPMLHRLSWAQWNATEIAKGEPFKWLLQSA